MGYDDDKRTMIYRLFISIVFFFFPDPEDVHRLSLVFLRVFRWWPPATAFPALEQKVFGLTFKNPVGLAAGFDKDGTALPGLEGLGFGFIEVGTVTALPQEGNPRPRLFKLPREEAIVNRMGFNNHGAEALAEALARTRTGVPIGISIGKSKAVALENAAADYRTSFEKLYPYGDYFIVNVSSPNTPRLRELQDRQFLTEIFAVLNAFRNAQSKKKPLLVKIAPDLSDEAIDDVLTVCREQGIDGIIATNTVSTEKGGLSGKPLQKRATEVIRYIHKKAPILPVIGVGGIFTAADAYEKIRAGASLVQIYTSFIYEGPFAARNINRGLTRLLKQDGFKNIAQAVGRG